jgi:hypothetical protein
LIVVLILFLIAPKKALASTPVNEKAGTLPCPSSVSLRRAEKEEDPGSMAEVVLSPQEQQKLVWLGSIFS